MTTAQDMGVQEPKFYSPHIVDNGSVNAYAMMWTNKFGQWVSKDDYDSLRAAFEAVKGEKDYLVRRLSEEHDRINEVLRMNTRNAVAANQAEARVKVLEKLLREFITTCEIHKINSDFFDMWAGMEAAKAYFTDRDAALSHPQVK
jgi:hypothetical protein